jgi:hypothetical protein
VMELFLMDSNNDKILEMVQFSNLHEDSVEQLDEELSKVHG